MRVAIVHDALVSAGGAERVVAALVSQWPGVPLYTSVYLREPTFDVFKHVDVRTTFLQRFVRSRNGLIEYAFPLLVPAFRGFDFSAFDIVLSSAAYAAKTVRVGPDTCHVCYCYSPLRIAWRPDDYLTERHGPIRRAAIHGAAAALRRWDYGVAQRVDYFATTCRNVAGRIRAAYNREAEVIYAPIDTALYYQTEPEDYYLVVSRLTRYKRIDLAIDAARRSQRRLVIVGEGPLRAELEARARGAQVQFVGSASDEDLRHWYARCRALIFPQEEDYGLTPLEAQASGRPVIAYGAGGALETIVAGRTGVFFAEQTADSLVAAMHAAEATHFDPSVIRAHAARFDVAPFGARMLAFLEEKLDQFRRDRPRTASRASATGERRNRS